MKIMQGRKKGRKVEGRRELGKEEGRKLNHEGINAKRDGRRKRRK